MAGRQQGGPPFNSSANHCWRHRKFAGHKSGWQTQLEHRETGYDGPGLHNAPPSAPVLEFDEAYAPEVSTLLEQQRQYSQSARTWPRGGRRPGVPEYGLDKRSRSQDAFVCCPVLASAPERGHLMPAAGTPAQAAPLKLGPSSLGYAAREKLTVVPACRSPRGPEAARTSAVVCHGRSTCPRSALWPLQGYRARAARLRTTPARSGLEWM